MDTRPIGVFDSGLGGLTAVRQLRRLLPGEDIVYFGDTGRVPYGSCAGLARCDFFVGHGTGRVLCNELNTLPGFTPISMYPKLMENEGYSFAALVDKLIGLALSKKRGAY